MPFHIFGKLIPAVLSALLFIAPVSPAAAWDEICVKFAAGVGYAGHFNVIHGFEPRDDGKMPGRAVADGLMGTSGLSPRDFRNRMGALAAELANARAEEENARPEAERLLRELSETNTWDPDYYANSRYAASAERILHQRQQARENAQKRLNGLTSSLTWIPGIVHNPPDVFAEDAPPARGAVRSGRIAFPNTGCVSIRDLPMGEPFYVLLYADKKIGSRHVVCGTHSSNPNWWYRNRPNQWTQKLEYNARGSLLSPRCEYAGEY